MQVNRPLCVMLQRHNVDLRTVRLKSQSPLNDTTASGAGTNVKVGGGAVHVRRQIRNFFVVPLNFFGFASTISRFGERFRDGQCSLVSLLFAVLLLAVTPCPAICKSGGTCPRAVWTESVH